MVPFGQVTVTDVGVGVPPPPPPLQAVKAPMIISVARVVAVRPRVLFINFFKSVPFGVCPDGAFRLVGERIRGCR